MKNELTAPDTKLIDEALQYLNEVFMPKKHYVVALFRDDRGTIHRGHNYKTHSGKSNICAEMVALTELLQNNQAPDTFVVILRTEDGEERIITPCGACRDLLCDYAPDAHAIIKENGHLIKIPVKSLLPYAYSV